MNTIHFPPDFQLDSLMIALQRTGSTTVSQAICRALRIDHDSMDQFYSYNLCNVVGELNMKDAIQTSPKTGQTFYFYNFLGYVDEKEMGTLPLFYEMIERAKNILVLERHDALTHALSMRFLHLYSWWRKEQETLPADYFKGMKAFIDQGHRIELKTLVRYCCMSAEFHSRIRDDVGDRGRFVNHYDLFHDFAQQRIFAEVAIAEALGIPLGNQPVEMKQTFKHTNPQTLTNLGEIEDFFGRTLDEWRYWKYVSIP